MSRKQMLLRTLGLSLSLATIALYLPTEFSSNNLVHAMEQGNQGSLQANQGALDFIKQYAKPEEYRVWNEVNELYMTDQQREELREFVTKEVIKNPQVKPIEKAEQIFEWIKREVRYAHGSQIPEINPYKVWKKKVAVCGGYSHLYKAMLNAADIPSVIVFGTIPSGSSTGSALLDPAHQWNAVYTDGEWFYSDSTWGGNFFHKTVQDFSKDHKTTNVHRVTYEEGNMTLGYEYSGLTVTGVKEQTEDLVIPAMSKGLPIVGISTELANTKAAIKSIHLGANVQSFETAALAFPSLDAIQVAEQNPYFTARDGVLFKKDLSEILYYPENKRASSFTIPKETRKYDEKQTFQNPYLTSLSVEEGNPQFSSYKGALFDKNQTRLLTVAEGATEVSIPGTVKLDNIALSFKSKIQKVVLEEGIVTIPSAVFNGNDSLREIVLPDSLETIDDDAFSSINKGNLTLVGKADSPAKDYAQRHGIAFRTKVTDASNTEDGSDEETRAELMELIATLFTKIQQLKSSDYIPSAWAEFKNEVQQFAKNVNKDATTTELEEALTKLGQAFVKLTTHGKVETNGNATLPESGEGAGEALVLDDKPVYSGELATVGTPEMAELPRGPESIEGAGEALVLDDKPVYSGELATVGTPEIVELPIGPESIAGAGEALVLDDKPVYSGELVTVGTPEIVELPIGPESIAGAGEALVLDDKPVYSGELATVGTPEIVELPIGPESIEGAGLAPVMPDKPIYEVAVEEAMDSSVPTETSNQSGQSEEVNGSLTREEAVSLSQGTQSLLSPLSEKKQIREEKQVAGLESQTVRPAKVLPKTGQDDSTYLISILGVLGLHLLLTGVLERKNIRREY